MNATCQRPRTDTAGFSVVEVLVAAAVLLIMTVGLLPMFVRSINNNVQGEQLNQLVQRSSSGLERVVQANYLDPRFDSDGETIELYSRTDRQWYAEDDFPSDQEPAYRRAVRVRRLDIGEIDADGRLELDPAASTPDLKEVEIAVTNIDGTVFGPARQLTVRFIKAF